MKMKEKVVRRGDRATTLPSKDSVVRQRSNLAAMESVTRSP